MRELNADTFRLKRLEEAVRALKGEDDYMRAYAARIAIRAAHELPNRMMRTHPSIYAHAAQLMRRHLLRYVETWCDVKPDFSAWIQRNPELNNEVTKAAYQTRFKLTPTKRTGAILSRSSPLLQTNGVRAIAAYDAAWLFIDVIVNTVDHEVGRCHRCKEYYLNFSGHRNKVYCSRRCATGWSAKVTMSKRRMEEKREKLARATELCKAWKPPAAKEQDWKQWVAKRSGLTPKWLTRAVNRGELEPPISTQSAPAVAKKIAKRSR
jgi:hypothetical protein